LQKSLRCLATLGGMAASLFGASKADALIYMLDPYTGSPAQVQLTLTQMNPNSVQFNLQVVANPNIGDLRGIFLNIANDSLLSGLTVTGEDITQTVLGPAGTVGNLGGGNNINPEGPFDIGLSIGTSGIGSDDIQNTAFTISSATNLPVSLFTTQTDPINSGGPNQLLFGVRMTSVGLLGGARDGSSKLGIVTQFFPDPHLPQSNVPEPGAMALLLAGGGTGFFLLRLRKRVRP
jgi:hypothetical protein